MKIDLAVNVFATDRQRTADARPHTEEAPWYWDETMLQPYEYFSTDELPDRGVYASLTEMMAYDASEDPTKFLNDHERNASYLDVYFNESGSVSGLPNAQSENYNDPNGDINVRNILSYFSGSQPNEAGFFVPGGIAAVPEENEEFLYIWHDKYRNNWYCDQAHLARLSMDDLLNAHEAHPEYLGLTSEQKFIEVNPILIDRATHPESDDPNGCTVPWTSVEDRGFLSYGVGMDAANWIELDTPSDFPEPHSRNDAKPDGFCTYSPGSKVTNGTMYTGFDNCSFYRRGSGYRHSDLYLSYLSLNDVDFDSDLRQTTYYNFGPNADCNGNNTGFGQRYGGNCWCKGDEATAQPIISAGSTLDRQDCGIMSQRKFGEFSVRRVPNPVDIVDDEQYVALVNCANTTTSVVMATFESALARSELVDQYGDDDEEIAANIDVPNYGCQLRVRAANLRRPWNFSNPKRLSRQTNYGYGNYIIEKSLLRTPYLGEPDVLWFSRVVSTWGADIHFRNYGASIFHSVLNFGELIETIPD